MERHAATAAALAFAEHEALPVIADDEVEVSEHWGPIQLIKKNNPGKNCDENPAELSCKKVTIKNKET